MENTMENEKNDKFESQQRKQVNMNVQIKFLPPASVNMLE